MGSRYWRTMAASFVVGTILEYCVALALSYYPSSSNLLFGALLILLALWALQLVLWIKNIIVSTAFYYLMGKKMWVAEIEAALRKGEFPVYDDYRPDAVDYLSTVARDERSTTDQILFAAGSLGQISYLRANWPVLALRMLAVCEAALDNYFRNPHPGPIRRSELSTTSQML
jgi:hypothetical protein